MGGLRDVYVNCASVSAGSVVEARLSNIVNPIGLEAGLRPNSAGIHNTLLLRIGAIGFPTFGLLILLYKDPEAMRQKLTHSVRDALRGMGSTSVGLGQFGFTV